MDTKGFSRNSMVYMWIGLRGKDHYPFLIVKVDQRGFARAGGKGRLTPRFQSVYNDDAASGRIAIGKEQPHGRSNFH